MFLSGKKPEPDPADWFVAQLRPNQLIRARSNLERQGYHCFMPQLPQTARKRGKLMQNFVPIFPGYIFVSIGPEQQWYPVNNTYGVSRLVMRDGKTPQPVPAEVMRHLLGQTGPDGIFTVTPDLAPGDRVRILSSPWAEHVVEVDRLAGPERVSVLLEMMGQATRVQLDRRHLSRIAG